MHSLRTRILFSVCALFAACASETIVEAPDRVEPPPPPVFTATFIYDKPDEGRIGQVGLRKEYSDANIGGLVCPNPGELSTIQNPVTVSYVIDFTYLSQSGHYTTWSETVSQTFTFDKDTTITL